MTELLTHQQEGVDFLMGRANGALAFDPGLGKTRVCIEALDKLGIMTSILIVCPAIAREHWRDEFKRWSNVPRNIVTRSGVRDAKTGDVTIVSYDYLSLLSRDHFVSFRNKAFKTVIFDEAHRLKNTKAKRTKYAYGVGARGSGGLSQYADRVWLLSGTFAPNHAGEIFPHLSALFPETVMVKDIRLNRTAFEDTYCRVFQSNFGRTINGSKNIKVLREKIKPHFLVRKEADCLDLPDLDIQTYGLPTAGVNAHDIQQINKALEGYANDVESLRKADIHLATERRVLGLCKAPLIGHLIQSEMFDDQLYDKLVVFYWHKEVGHYFEDRFHGSMRIGGDVPDRKRQEHIKAFQNDDKAQILIAQTTAAGEAITLTRGHECMLAEPSWVPKDNYQAIKRLHRIGQNKRVRARVLTLAHTMDHLIMQRVVRKMKDIHELMKRN